MLSELVYADNLVLLSESIEELRSELRKLKKTFEGKGVIANLGNTNVIVSGGITKDGLSKDKVYQCGIYSLSVKVNLVLCVQCYK